MPQMQLLSVVSHRAGRWQSKMLLTIDERGSKFPRNCVFDCHLSPVSKDFYLRSSIILMFTIAAYLVQSFERPQWSIFIHSFIHYLLLALKKQSVSLGYRSFLELVVSCLLKGKWKATLRNMQKLCPNTIYRK